MFETDEKPAYRVLARKYRPQNFAQLIGQEALVTTLTNAIASGRVAHAFMLTGVRGVGKTTTARIIAKALNYTGPDGTSGPTTGPTDDCAICRAISEDRHPDVMEMDAASRTGVDDIREILDGVRYAPTSARYKVYIIDEVHMLSKNAFNALLKTLEEPPEHVKFIFATTEIRKVPVTVLSRCQRFDLRRVEPDVLIKHFSWVCHQEQVAFEDEAIAMIARAAGGSVRDGLSLLDQAMAMSSSVSALQVKTMLGLADRSALLNLMENLLKGEAGPALEAMALLYRAGADPETILNDLLDLTHIMSKFQSIAAPPATVEPNMTADERARTARFAADVTMPALGRVWQILLKGLQEVQYAPNAQAAAEMVVMRICFAANLPDPATVIKKLKDGSYAPAPSGARTNTPASGGAVASIGSIGSGAAQALPKVMNEPVTSPVANSNLETLGAVIGLLEQNGAMILASQIYHCAELVKLEAGRLEFHPTPEADPKLAPDVAKKLSEITGLRWMVSVSNKAGHPTLAAQAEAARLAELEAVKADPAIRAVLHTFPNAHILSITNKDDPHV